MLRGPVQTSFPSLDALPREAGTSGHVYPFSARSASPSLSQTDTLRLPSNIASATFWRSPYSEALRQSKSYLNKRAEGPASYRHACPGLDDKPNGEGGERTCSTAADSKKTGSSDGKDLALDLTGENVQQLRGILCKSSLSSSSRQSGPKVQKRVKFEDSVDKGQTPRQSQSAGCGHTSPKQDSPTSHRSLSASVTSKPPVRMPSLRLPSDRQQEEKSGPPPSPSPSPTLLPNPHQYPHIPRSSAGSLVRTSSMSELTLPRPSPKPGNTNAYQLLSGPHSCMSTGPGSTSSRLSSTGQDFKVYRQSLASPGPSTRVVDGAMMQSAAVYNKGRFFATPAHSTANRTYARLSRSFTSPAITLPRPVKRPVPSSSSNDDLPFTPPASRTAEGVEKAITTRDLVQAIQADVNKDAAEKRESFLDDDKTVQILHWLQEVGQRQAREGRCPVFASASSRDV